MGAIDTNNYGQIASIATGSQSTTPEGASRRRLALWTKPGFAENLVLRIGWKVAQDGTLKSSLAFPLAGQQPSAVFTIGIPADSSASSGMFLEVECGAGGQSVTFSCDIASGTIQLPPCESAKVSLVSFGAAIQTIDVPITAVITPGIVPNAPPPTFTQIFHSVAGTYTRMVPIPPCARAVDLWPALQPSTVADLTKFRLELVNGANIQKTAPLIVRDYSATPPSMLPYAGPVDWTMWGSDRAELTCTQTVATAMSVAVRWYLAP